MARYDTLDRGVPCRTDTLIMLRIAFALAMSSLAIGGCAGRTPPLPTSSATLTVVDDAALPAPTLSDRAGLNRGAAVGPYDKLIIDVYGMKDLSARPITVDAGGHISFPLTGSFNVSGMTAGEIENELERRLQAAYVRDPQVSVNLEEINSQIVTVDGQVTRPGLYPVLDRMTLMQAVARAEGLTEFAKQDDVVIFRNVQGQRYVALYNIGAIRRGYYEDPQIFAGDVVVVGESRGRRLFRDILAAVPLLTAPIIAVIQNQN